MTRPRHLAWTLPPERRTWATALAPERRTWATALASIVLASCAPSHGSRLQGRWHGARVEGVTGAATAAANDFALHLELTFDGESLRIYAPHRAENGRYRVVRDSGASVVIYTDGDGPGEPQTFRFAGDGTLRWEVMPGKAIVLARESGWF